MEFGKISIIVPAHNEEKRIGKTLEKYSIFFEDLRKKKILEYQILVVINNTKDATQEVVKRYSSLNKNINCMVLIRGGKGYAVVEGFKRSLKEGYEVIGFVDADMATSPEEYWKLITNMKGVAGVIADRYHKDSKIYPPPSTQRLLAKRLFNFVVRSVLLLPYGDTQCGAKIFRRNALEMVLPKLTMSKWAFDVDLLYVLKKQGFKVRSCPTVWIDKEYSKINFWQAGPWMVLAILRLRILNSPLKRFIKIYDKFVGFIPK